MKICSKCKISKPETDYYPEKRTVCGLEAYCKKCHLAYKKKPSYKRVSKERYSRLKNNLQEKYNNTVAPIGDKCCICCKKFINIKNFPKHRTKIDGFSSFCNDCTKEQRKEWYRLNQDHIKNYRYKTTYGKTLDEIKNMLEKQQFKCLICCTEITIDTKQVDHNHETGKVRGLLCFLCNIILGASKDSPERLTKAINYLIEFDS